MDLRSLCDLLLLQARDREETVCMPMESTRIESYLCGYNTVCNAQTKECEFHLLQSNIQLTQI